MGAGGQFACTHQCRILRWAMAHVHMWRHPCIRKVKQTYQNLQRNAMCMARICHASSQQSLAHYDLNIPRLQKKSHIRHYTTRHAASHPSMDKIKASTSELNGLTDAHLEIQHGNHLKYPLHAGILYAHLNQRQLWQLMRQPVNLQG